MPVSMNEALRSKYNSQYQRALLEKWKNNISSVKKVYPKFSDISAINLAIVCENTAEKIAKYKQMVSEGTQAADVGPYVRQAFELLTAIMPNLVSEEVISVQALNNKIGQIFFLKYVYGSNKGTTKKGETAFGPYEVNAKEHYTDELVEEELVGVATDTAFSANLAYTPVISGTAKITITTDGVATECGDVPTANGKGDIKVLVDGRPTGTKKGEIDYASGAITLTTTADDEITATYEYSLEYAPTKAVEFDMQIAEKIVVARPRRLRTNYAFSAAYDVEKQFGIKMDDELLEASILEIKHEIDQEILNDLKRQAGITGHTWDATQKPAISLMQHYEAFLINLNEGANKIFKATKRVHGNFVIAGINVLNIIQSLPGFVPASGADDQVGAYVAGTLKNGMKVIADPFYDDDDYVIGYKGSNFLDAGYVYAPYLPVFATNVIMLDDFVGRRGYATSYAKAMLCPNYYVRCKLTHGPQALAANVTVVNTTENPVYTSEVQ